MNPSYHSRGLRAPSDARMKEMKSPDYNDEDENLCYAT